MYEENQPVKLSYTTLPRHEEIPPQEEPKDPDNFGSLQYSDILNEEEDNVEQT